MVVFDLHVKVVARWHKKIKLRKAKWGISFENENNYLGIVVISENGIFYNATLVDVDLYQNTIMFIRWECP